MLERRPDLQGMAAIELGVKLVEPGRRRVRVRPEWRDKRREAYIEHEWWAVVKATARMLGISVSALMRWIVRSWWLEFRSRDMQVLDGEVIGWQDEAA